MAGKHRARKTIRRQGEAYALLGAGAVTLGLGVALTAGSGVAQAEPNNAVVSGSSGAQSAGRPEGTTSIRTVISAQSVNTSTGDGQPTSVVTTKDSIVRQMDPAVTGDNNAGPSLGESVLDNALGNQNGLTAGVPGLDFPPEIPFIEFGGGGGGLLSTIAGALTGGLL